jgi:hypothetical protein
MTSDERLAHEQRALSERCRRTRGPIRCKDGEVLVVSGGSIYLNIGEEHGVQNGLRFCVWRRGKQLDCEEFALVEVYDLELRHCATRAVEWFDPRPITKGMAVSNPFFDPKRELTVYVPPHVRVCTPGDAEAWMQACGSHTSRSANDWVNVMVLAPNAGYPEYESDLREKARVAGAIVVEEDDLLTP